ncbi:MAG: PepSY-like domain-containing protein [Filimonas sp.]|nr:PepSY-like domain-containing protein [Filimonas sp.]
MCFKTCCVALAYKTICAFSAFFLFSSLSIAQGRLIPAKVKSAFRNMYPDVQNESWGASTKNYTANFTQGTKPIKSTFTENGDWLWSAMEISLNELPYIIYNTFKRSAFKDHQILHVNLVSSTRDLLRYEIEVEGNFKEKVKLHFTNTGEMTVARCTF